MTTPVESGNVGLHSASSQTLGKEIMKKIIALKGRGGSGKSTTIKMLPSILLKNGYTQVDEKYQKHGFDILDVFQKEELRVGI